MRSEKKSFVSSSCFAIGIDGKLPIEKKNYSVYCDYSAQMGLVVYDRRVESFKLSIRFIFILFYRFGSSNFVGIRNVPERTQ